MHKSDGVVRGSLHPSAIADVLRVIRLGEATSRAEIARRIGLARSTVSQQVEYLLGRGILDEDGSPAGERGRPARTLRISARAGVIAVVDIDIPETRIALASLSGRIVRRFVLPLPVDEGPARVLEAASDCIASAGDDEDEPSLLRHVVVGLPAPVDFRRGRAVRPPILPGWDGFPVADELRVRLGVPVVVDNDVNLAALGEAAQEYADAPLIVVKLASGIGAGLITASGEIHRGADGAAGDIGHIRTSGNDGVPCRCGQNGCLEAVASFSAVTRALEIPGERPQDVAAGIEILRSRAADGDPDVLRALRVAAEEIGAVAAALIQMFNPRTLVLTGPLSEGHDEILSGVRGVVYGRSVPLTTRELTLTTSQLGADAEVLGGVELALREVWSPAGIARLLERTS